MGEAAHKGQVFPGEHEAIVSRALWDAVHGLLRESPRVRANTHRNQSPALLKGLIFGVDGRALSPTHTRRRGRLYRYYVAQRVLKGDAGRGRAGAPGVGGRDRGGGHRPGPGAATAAGGRGGHLDGGAGRGAGLTEAEVRDALGSLDPLWGELFPAEQARIVRLLVERVEVGPRGLTSGCGSRGWPGWCGISGRRRCRWRRDAPGSLTVRVPLAIRRRPGRKTVVTPGWASSGPGPIRRC